MFKNILVPIDLSHVEKGSTSVEMAQEFAKKHDCELTLLYVIPEGSHHVVIEVLKDLHDKIVSTAEIKLRDIAKRHKLAASTKSRVEYGHPVQEILKVAADIHADLILVASHQPGLSDYLLGSVAGKVVRHARCSVLVIR